MTQMKHIFNAMVGLDRPLELGRGFSDWDQRRDLAAPWWKRHPKWQIRFGKPTWLWRISLFWGTLQWRFSSSQTVSHYQRVSNHWRFFSVTKLDLPYVISIYLESPRLIWWRFYAMFKLKRWIRWTDVFLGLDAQTTTTTGELCTIMCWYDAPWTDFP